MEELKLIGKISWQALLKRWRTGEAKDEEWTNYWKTSGFKSWEEWRAPIIKVGRSQKWTLYTITDPLKSVPKFFGGPFKGWQENYYRGHFTSRFSSIVRNRGERLGQKITGLLHDFPSHTTLFGVRYRSRIYVVDGMHRSCALAVIARSPKLKREFSKKTVVQIAITDTDLYKLAHQVKPRG